MTDSAAGGRARTRTTAGIARVAALTLAVTLMVIGAASAQTQRPQTSKATFAPTGVAKLDVSALSASRTDLARRYPKAANRLRDGLANLMDRHVRQGKTAAMDWAKKRGIDLADDSVTVVLTPSNSVTPDDLAATVRRNGMVVQRVGRDYVKASVPISLLETLGSNTDGLAHACLPKRPRLDNSIISEGVGNDLWMNAQNWQDHGLKGDGVKVGIIDAGFIGLADAVSAGEIPSSAVAVDMSGRGIETDTEHGCGVAEIVHDVAPSAQLYLIKIYDNTDLEEAETYCKANGIRVVNHSMGWYNCNFYDGIAYSSALPSPVNAVDDAEANGILWSNSAGNDRWGHMLTQWKDGDGDGWLDLTSSYGNVNQIGYLSAGTSIVLFMTWNAWPTTNQDFDIYLVYWSGSAWKLVDTDSQGQSIQNGSQSPTEEIAVTAPTDAYYGFAIRKYSATTSPTLIVRSWYEDIQYLSYDNDTTAAPGSIGCPADAASAMAVGAIDELVYRTGPSESFSSLGPNNRAYTGGTAVVRPDICGPDFTASYTYSSGFGGTSAASPHLAGAAALVWSRFPTFTNAQVREYLQTGGSNPDLGTTGKDNEFGYGPCVLSKVWYVSGTVLDYSAGPAAGVQVVTSDGIASGTTDESGNYTLLVPDGWSGTISVTATERSFDPAGQTVASVASDQSNVNFTELDTIPPTITSPADITVSADPGSCHATNVDLGTPVTSDNVAVQSVTNDAPTEFPVGATVVTWTVADSSDNQASCTQTVTVLADPTHSISSVKLLADATPVCVGSKTVTAVYGDGFYIEETDRTSGILVIPPAMPAGLAVGVKVDLSGAMKTNDSGERYIGEACVAVTGE